MEKWERIYPKFFYAIVAFALFGWVAAFIDASMKAGTLSADATNVAKWLAVVLPMLLFWWKLAGLRSVRSWAARNRLNTGLFIFAQYSSIMLAVRLVAFRSQDSWLDVLGMSALFAIGMSFIFGPIKSENTAK